MVALYVTSLESGEGKTAVCAGLGKLLLANGKSVGFFKPAIGEGGSNGDVAFVKNLFGLNESVDIIAPVFRDEAGLRNGLKDAYAKATSGKDMVIIEGISGQRQASADVVAGLEARVIVIAGYSEELSAVIEESRRFGPRLMGVIINKVPKLRLERVRDEVPKRFGAAGIKVLGMLPEDRSLLALTVGELASQIHGEVLRGAGKAAELVENFMLGAHVFDNTMGVGVLYFGRKANKAAVLQSERPDMQMAAMETSTACLVLTGNTPLKEIVLNRAQEQDVPIILTPDNVPGVIAQLEEALSASRFHQESKLPKLIEMMRDNLDMAAVQHGLGL